MSPYERARTLAFAGLLCSASTCLAQQPSRTITIIVPYTAGDNTPDILARVIGTELQQRWGQPVVVENKPGASGNIGTAAAARTAPDGHTLLMVAPAFAQNVGLFKGLPYDPIKDFVPVILAARTSLGLVIHPSLPSTTVKDFIAYAKSRPGELNYSSPGHGTPHHLTMELFRLSAGISLKHVPYRGSAPAVQDLVGGHVSAMFLPLPVALPLAKDNRLRLLAVAEERRTSIAPDVPTLGEQGVPGVVVGIWNGLLAPAGTPDAIVQRYNAVANEILLSGPITQRLAAQGVNVVGGGPDRLAMLIAQEVPHWLKVVKEAGIQRD